MDPLHSLALESPESPTLIKGTKHTCTRLHTKTQNTHRTYIYMYTLHTQRTHTQNMYTYTHSTYTKHTHTHCVHVPHIYLPKLLHICSGTTRKNRWNFAGKFDQHFFFYHFNATMSYPFPCFCCSWESIPYII